VALISRAEFSAIVSQKRTRKYLHLRQKRTDKNNTQKQFTQNRTVEVLLMLKQQCGSDK